MNPFHMNPNCGSYGALENPSAGTIALYILGGSAVLGLAGVVAVGFLFKKGVSAVQSQVAANNAEFEKRAAAMRSVGAGKMPF